MVIRLVLAEDHAMVREGLLSLLASEAQVQVVASTDNGRDCVQLVETHRPHVVVMDIGLPDLNGAEATRRILQRFPDTGIVALSVDRDRRYVAEMLKAGAQAYVVKDSSFSELVSAVEAVAAGRTYLSSACADVVVEDYLEHLRGRRDWDEQSTTVRLTPRELEVLRLIAEGCTTKQIAARLVVSPKTVETHRRQLMDKLGIYSVAGLVKYALREGLATLEK